MLSQARRFLRSGVDFEMESGLSVYDRDITLNFMRQFYDSFDAVTAADYSERTDPFEPSSSLDMNLVPPIIPTIRANGYDWLPELSAEFWSGE